MRRTTWILVVTLLLAAAVAVAADPPKDFKSKFAALSKGGAGVFKVTARPGEEIPEATLNLAFGPGATISVSRGDEAPKDMLGDDDINSVVNRNLRTVKFCYCKALKADPEFEGEAIVGLKIKTSGSVEKVAIEPEDMAEHQFGKCLQPKVASWKFPKFSGKKEDGLTVTSMGYEFPLEFSPAEE
ncbi:MAG TPA: AgmX/PglI C-terminal domain-containing protein [Myxococcota bacterium]|nr:AgmX/PglI C-terminal domain-containing protein [Myxococcota bacterium]HRY91923.1 AgmX/PglI C-terminal domain-containing protein [Myxococcota bacterium]HSA21107.1 AgmX/PglI C-terminal domain-containing protein [Myxococcota bacterium]